MDFCTRSLLAQAKNKPILRRKRITSYSYSKKKGQRMAHILRLVRLQHVSEKILKMSKMFYSS